MIYVTLKTYVTNLLFTTQPQRPQYNRSHLAQKSTQCSTWPSRIKPESMQGSHTNIFTYVLYKRIRNMISVTLNTSVPNLTFTINSKCPKMKLRRPVLAIYLHTLTVKQYIREAHGIASVWLPHWHLLVRLMKYVSLVRESLPRDDTRTCFILAQ
jgi:hypothetical protein